MTETFLKPLGSLKDYKYVVILATVGDQLLLSRHRERTTWELPGGHIEPGETPLEAARRELWEETGAAEFDIEAISDYETTDDGWYAASVLFRAHVTKTGPLPQSEMAETRLFDALPADITYPGIMPVLVTMLDAERKL